MTNAVDKSVADAFRTRGWSVLDSGWPDLLVYDLDRRSVMGVELKRGADQLRPSQIEMAKVFKQAMGVPLYVAREDDIAGLIADHRRAILPGRNRTAINYEIDELQRTVAAAKERLDALTQYTADLAMPFEEVSRFDTTDWNWVLPRQSPFSARSAS